MKRLFFASALFTGGAIFGLAMAAVLVLGLISVANPAPSLASSEGKASDVSVTISERQINALVSSQISGFPGFRNVSVKVESGGILAATGDADVSGIWLPVQVRGQLLAENGGVGFRVVDVKVGSLPVKADLARVIEEPIAEASNAALPLDLYRVSAVTSQPGIVTIDLAQR